MMGELPSWLDVVRPHRDIQAGDIDEPLFAADLGLVAEGKALKDYQDPEIFARQTYLTENLRHSLVRIGNRLAGEDGPSVFRMQTEFGGGKTHTMLAAYHLFGTPKAVAATPLGTTMAAGLRGGSLPKVRVAVLDGSALGVTPEAVGPDVTAHTFLGHLAWRLGGEKLYNMVRAQDEQLLGASTVALVDLLKAAAPCLILMDETLEYLSKALGVRTHEGDLAATTFTVIKELCSAASNVPGVAILLTLTASHLEDPGELANADLENRLSKVVGRTENVVTPVEGDDIFPILHTRLFDDIGDPTIRRTVAEAYRACYRKLGEALPSSYSDVSYLERIEQAYPFHPALIDILTDRWASLPGFQRTRGALRTLAHTVKALSQANHPAPLIHPGDVPLDDWGVWGEVNRFAGNTYKAVLRADITLDNSNARNEDKRRGGEVGRSRIAVGMATTAFLNSFGPGKALGASAPDLLVGVARPDDALSKGILDDIRDVLAASLWYMRYQGGRYQFTTEPNLNKVIVEREDLIGESRITDLLHEALAVAAPLHGPFRVDTLVTESGDVPDNPRLTCGLLGFDYTLGGTQETETRTRAEEILTTHGKAGRTNRNALVLVAADEAGLRPARQAARSLAALRDISRDETRLKRFSKEQKEQVATRLDAAEARLPQLLTMAYRHLLLLGVNGDGGVQLDHVDLGPARVESSVPVRVAGYLRDNDRMVTEALAPAALLTERFGVLDPGKDAVEIQKVYTMFYRWPRLPKLASADVLRRCLANGVEQGLFGLASGASWNGHDGVLRYKVPIDPHEIQFQPGTWLIRSAAAQRLLDERAPKESGVESLADSGGFPSGKVGAVADLNIDADSEDQASQTSLPPTNPQRVTVVATSIPPDKIRDVIKVAVLPLASTGADVTVNLVITAGSEAGIAQHTLDLVVSEGLRQLDVQYEVRTE